MILLNPKAHDRPCPDERSREIMLKTIDFFEKKQAAVHGNLPHRLPSGPPGPGRFGAVHTWHLVEIECPRRGL